jgi:predicted DNA-binding transcriptional regulator YafY
MPVRAGVSHPFGHGNFRPTEVETTMSSTLLRQWAMLRMVPRHPRKITVSQLRHGLEEQGYETTVRTIQRDLQALSGQGFALVADDRSRPHGWQWARDARILDVPGMEPQTALAFKLAQQFLAPLMAPATLQALGPYFRQAGEVLKVTPGSVRRWPRKVRTVTRGQSLIPPAGDPDVLRVVYEALFQDRQFRTNYRRRKDNLEKEYVVNPLGLVFRDGVIYLICTLFDYTDIVQMVLHRMTDATPMETPVRRPRGFDLDRYLKEGGLDFRLGEEISVCLDVHRDTAHHLGETPLSRDQRMSAPDAEGWVTVRATVPDTSQLRWWILGLGARIRVRTPKRLRTEIRAALREAAALYPE